MYDLALKQLTHWPINYDMAMARIYNVKEQLHYGSIQIKSDLLDRFSQLLLLHLNEYNQFKNAFFCHEVRGFKAGRTHNPNDMDAYNKALEYMCCDIDTWQTDAVD